MLIYLASGELIHRIVVSGQGIEDASYPSPYMFAGGRFGIEIGLYYNRARHYNPFTGRYRRQSIYPDDP